MTTESQPQSKKRKRASMCVGCGSTIQDQYILRVAPDLEWHAACLKCADCNQYLDETCTCFVRDGKTYCKRDYVRLFGTKCTKCSLGFSKTDFVMRARNKIFHMDCFRCVACSRQLTPGDEFALREDGLFCKADHDVLERAGQNSESPTITNNNNNNNNNSKNNNKNNNNNNEDIKIGANGLHTAGHAEQTPHIRERIRPHVHKSEQKTTRVRTVLNEKQLHTLRTCYNANPRPDALMKEQLVEMTNLSPRVIRVWFQNKRCKDKKKSVLMKQIQEQQQKSGQFTFQNGSLQRPLQGVPMVASSPVRHEQMQANQVEVQSYQPPWKALSEFAMQSEIEQPPFQQLVNSFDQADDSSNSMYHMDDSVVSHYGGCLHPGSVSSDMPRTPSELSSPMSQ